MADPVIVDIPKDAWLPVITNVVAGFIDRMTADPTVYYFTTRLNLAAAPLIIDPNDPDFEGVPKFLKGLTVDIEANEPTDIYILCLGDAGKVQVTV